MRVVAYCRVSTSSDEQLNSLSNQINHYKEFLKKLEKDKNYIIPNVGKTYNSNRGFTQGLYIDEGISATKSYKYRVAFNQMLEDAKQKKFDRIYIKNIRRFSRNVEEAIKILKDLKEIGIEIKFEEGDMSNYDNDLIINLLLLISQQESVHKSNSIKFGIRHAQKEGKRFGAAPYGYDAEKANLVINSNEAKIVKEIFQLYLNEGYGTQKIARRLNYNNIPTKKGVLWSQKQITDILKNSIYFGQQVSHITESLDINRSTIKKIPESERIYHTMNELKIIDSNIFELTQDEIQKRREMSKYKTKHSNKHLLSNLLICHNCGTALRRKKRNSTRDIGYEWTCNLHDRYGNQKCKFRNAVIENDMLNFIKEEFIKYISNIHNLDNLFQKYKDTYFSKPDLDEDEINNNINVLNDRQNKITDLYTEDEIDKDTFLKQNKRIENELKLLHKSKLKIKTYDKQIEIIKSKFEIFKNDLQSIDLNNLTNSKLKEFINSIVICKDPNLKGFTEEITINWMFMDKNIIRLNNDHIDFNINNIYKNNAEYWKNQNLTIIDINEVDIKE